MSHTAASHQRAIKICWITFRGVLVLSIFIRGRWSAEGNVSGKLTCLFELKPNYDLRIPRRFFTGSRLPYEDPVKDPISQHRLLCTFLFVKNEV